MRKITVSLVVAVLAAAMVGQTTSPAAKPVGTSGEYLNLPTLMSKVPANMQTAKVESDRHKRQRDTWLVVTAEGQEVEAKVVITKKPEAKAVVGRSDAADMRCEFSAAIAQPLKVGDTIVVHGKLAEADTSLTHSAYVLKSCSVASVTATTKPAK